MLKPLGGNVIVRKAQVEKATPGGLIIPETAKGQETVFRGEVIAVGRGRVLDSGRFLETELRIGDHVLIGKARGYEVEHEGEKLLVISGEDVIAVVVPR